MRHPGDGSRPGPRRHAGCGLDPSLLPGAARRAGRCRPEAASRPSASGHGAPRLRGALIPKRGIRQYARQRDSEAMPPHRNRLAPRGLEPRILHMAADQRKQPLELRLTLHRLPPLDSAFRSLVCSSLFVDLVIFRPRGLRQIPRCGYGCLYYAALRPEEAVSLARHNLLLPEKGWEN
jgi:hypothetical protein